MEFVTGVKKKETLELSELLEEGRIGTEVKVNGAIHTIRDMGTVAFIILRKREGLVQCVYEEGVSKFNLKDVKEADTVEVSGMLERSEKAPNGIEIRLGELKILSEPAEPMPLPIAKWKLNTSLEIKLQTNFSEKYQRACKIQDSGRYCKRVQGFPLSGRIYRDPYSEDRCEKC